MIIQSVHNNNPRSLSCTADLSPISIPTDTSYNMQEAVLCWLSAISCTRPVRIPSSTCTNRLLLAALEEPENSSTTQKEDVKKTPSISKHCMCSYYTHFCFVNDHGKFSMGILTYTLIYSCSSDPIILLLEACTSLIYTAKKIGCFNHRLQKTVVKFALEVYNCMSNLNPSHTWQLTILRTAVSHYNKIQWFCDYYCMLFDVHAGLTSFKDARSVVTISTRLGCRWSGKLPLWLSYANSKIHNT